MKALRIAALAGCALLATGPATAQDAAPSSPGLPIITAPTWASIPDQEAMSDAHPQFAVMAGFTGIATLQCIALPDGQLSRCEVQRAQPAGLGLDRAALTLVPKFRVNPLDVGGHEMRSIVQFGIRFLPAEMATDVAWTGAEPSAEHIANVRALHATFEPEVEQYFELSLVNLGVDPDRDEKVRAMIRQVEADFAPRMREAEALAVARLMSPEELSRVTQGLGYPPEPSPEIADQALDRATAVQIEMEARLRSLYCAQYSCPTIDAPPPDAVRPPDRGPNRR